MLLGGSTGHLERLCTRSIIAAHAMVLLRQIPHRASLQASSSTAATAIRIQRCALHDLTVKHKTGLPIQRAGPFGGGR